MNGWIPSNCLGLDVDCLLPLQGRATSEVSPTDQTGAGIPPTHALSLVLGVGCPSDSALHQDQGKQVVGYEARLVVAKHGLVSYQSYSVQSGSPVSAIEHQPPGTRDTRERHLVHRHQTQWGDAVSPSVLVFTLRVLMSRSAG